MHVRAGAYLREHLPMLGGRSFALLSPARNPARAVVFVHGFVGGPARTWRRFNRPIHNDTWWGESDLFFVGYPSAREEVRLTSQRLGDLLRGVLPRRPAALSALVDAEEPTSDYEQLVIAGHSQGGLVVREAVLQALWEQTAPGLAGGAWKTDPALSLIAEARIRLFAPAINGARLTGIKRALVETYGIGTLVRAISPSYHELQQLSNVVSEVRAQTTTRAEAHPDVRAFRARIAWATSDSVVTSGSQYAFDPRSEWLEGTTHKTVCKPTHATDPQVRHVTRDD